MSDPTRLTPEDLPTLRKLADWFDERGRCDFNGDEQRGPLLRWWRTTLAKAGCHMATEVMQRAVLAVQNTGHLASDARVDEHGRVTPL